jgi:hypothetical protein
LEAASQQTMWVPVLGSAGTGSGECRQAVAFQNLDLLEIFHQSAGHRQPADSSSHHDRAPTQETAHAATLLQIRDGQITARKPKGLFRSTLIWQTAARSPSRNLLSFCSLSAPMRG